MTDRRLMQSRAHAAVHRAVKAGELTRQPCFVCSSQQVEAHHEDYALPIDVVWLCWRHHSQRHRGLSFVDMLEREDAARVALDDFSARVAKAYDIVRGSKLVSERIAAHSTDLQAETSDGTMRSLTSRRAA